MAEKDQYYTGKQTGISRKEQQYTEDLIGALRVSSKKYQNYAFQCQNEKVRRLCQHVAQHQQDDMRELQSFLTQNSGKLQ